MARYANLKDYFQHEHIQLIQDAISDYLRHDVQISETVIHSLVCTNDDAEYNAEFEIGVSVNAVDVEETDALKFIITVRGNLEKRFKDIHVMSVRNINDDSFPDDNILSQFILPNIPKDKIEDIGNDLYRFCADKGLFVDYKKYIEKLSSNGMIHFANLPDNCLGRVILSESDVEIIQNAQTEYGLKPEKFNIRAAHGTILLNYEKYAEEKDGRLRITVAHELVHTLFHGRFLKVLQLLGEEKVDMHSSTESFALNENVTDIQKALCIAEWQADVLAMRLAIPGCTIDDALVTAASYVKNNYKITNRGDRNQACVIVFSEIYGVSCYVAKERMRQLGYDFVDGTIIERDGKSMPPFIFPHNTLKDDETFVIDRENYERLLRKNKEFAELLEKRYFVYIGYVVCYNHPKYIKHKISHGVIEYALSDYAREHADECCYKFKYTYTSNQNIFTEYPICQYLCKLDDLRLTIITDGNASAKQYKAIMDKIREDKKKAEKTKARMLLADITTFSDAFKYHKKQIKGLTYHKIEKDYGIPEETLKAYVAPKDSKRYRKPSIEKMMLLCHAFKLPHDTAIEFLTKAKTPLEEDNALHMLYDDLLRIPDEPIDTWNKYLTENGEAALTAATEKTDEK